MFLLLIIYGLFLGDLHDEEKVLAWLTSQDVFEIKNEIEEVNRKMLDKLLEENEFMAVYFCKYSDKNKCLKCWNGAGSDFCLFSLDLFYFIAFFRMA